MTYTIEKVATLIGARRYGEAESTVGWLLTDSRSLCFPEQTLFFALRSQRNDGHRYIDDLYRRGVRNFVVESLDVQANGDRANGEIVNSLIAKYPDANFLKVPSTLAALQRLAERHRDEFQIPVVGITGSNGKTWVKEWLYQLFRPEGGVVRSPRSYNSQIGVPLSVWLLDEHSRMAFFEAGISEPGEMMRLRDIIQPTVGVFTSLGAAHQENFRSMDEKCMEKLQLMHDTEAIIYPSDDDVVSRCMRRSQYRGERIGWSRYDRNAAMYVQSQLTQETHPRPLPTGRGVDSSVPENSDSKTILNNSDSKAILNNSDCKTILNNSDSKSIYSPPLEGGAGGGSVGSVGSVGSFISYVYKGIPGSYTIPYIDEASIENSITCAAAALHLGLTPEMLAERMPLLEPIAMRLEVKEGQHGLTLINDAYNNDLQSLDIALDFMQRRMESNPQSKNPKSQTKKTLILSDIFQSGESAGELYGQVSDLVQKRGVDRFIGIGPELSAQAGRIGVSEKWFFQDVDQFLASTVFRSLHDEVVLLKGARKFGFERISELLEQKVHETILEVDLNAVVANLNHFRSFLRPETKMVCMIKADAYGAGAVEIAKTLQDHRVDYLAVAVADEGAELRRAGITQNIIVMNPEMSSFQTLFDYDLEPEVYSFRLLDALIRAARAQGITGWPIHIKFDTGMHRLGFNVQQTHPRPLPVGRGVDSSVPGNSDSKSILNNSDSKSIYSPPLEGGAGGGSVGSFETDLARLIDVLRHQQAVTPRSVFTHFVGSDSDDFDTFSARQFKLFDAASRQLQAAFTHKILRHIDNSAGIAHFPERQLDMVRLGIGLYGVEPYSSEKAHTSQLNCVSTLRTTILQIRDVPKDETVGYSRKGLLTRDSRIAAIPIGYADGLNRHLGCRHGYCLVNGKKAEYVGNICMDVALIDVTDIDCKEGDSVEIFGKNLPVSVLAEQLDTIPYEVLTGVSNRVKRVYFQD